MFGCYNAEQSESEDYWQDCTTQIPNLHGYYWSHQYIYRKSMIQVYLLCCNCRQSLIVNFCLHETHLCLLSCNSIISQFPFIRDVTFG